MSRVLYLIALENILDNPIFENQVRKLLAEILKLSEGKTEITIGCILPWFEVTRRGVYSNFRRHSDEMESKRKDLAAEGIKLVFTRGFVPSAFFQMGPVRLFWFALSSMPALLWLIRRSGANILHCRYYYASFAAILARKIFRKDYRVIFDVRSLLPEQGVINGNWSEKSLVFRFWKAAERWMLKYADITVAVSRAMTERLKTQSPETRMETIPNFADLNAFRPDTRRREEIRRKFGIENRRVLIFSGTIGPRYPADMMSEAIQTYFNIFGSTSFFLLLTSSDEKRMAPLKERLLSMGLEPGTHWTYLKVAHYEVPFYLAAADFGLLVMANFEPESGEPPWDEYVFPIKFAEYLAMGLPILTHESNRTTKELIYEYNVGAIFESDNNAKEMMNFLLDNYDKMKKKCLEAARKDFSLSRFSVQYRNIYSELAD